MNPPGQLSSTTDATNRSSLKIFSESGYKSAKAVMEKTQKKPIHIPFTYKDAQVFKDLFDVLKSVYGNDAQRYFRQYIKLWPQYRRLKASGVNVRFSPLRRRSLPLLIIDR
jgi:hypothetical protein